MRRHARESSEADLQNKQEFALLRRYSTGATPVDFVCRLVLKMDEKAADRVIEMLRACVCMSLIFSWPVGSSCSLKLAHNHCSHSSK